ncbi:tRNA uridine-5-carboxymethylaminomethyl(34) synthesis GTPase MnmE [Hoeflea olei]|uniref:tRNA modification GTPase MnmE n=1 Tax=Hoeflea olei TaxID=1480615 RepID=A0A1C1YUY9_9HYPH|nr:tRNA uridine-5-carboxymethylaminomethyl(34) synthesis GTPase MnmE [Hoeflea olei]OCW57341.1 tRNA modification GTPase TrmE [Hoeflea olei]
MRETIYALSSGQPPAGVAVIRISGPGVRFGLETTIGMVPPPRIAKLCEIRNLSGELLDTGLVLFFPGPNSFTGEDVGELQIHGSRASIAAVLDCLSTIEDFRPAEPGDFTRRAFENGRMDLTAVEGLSDLIRAETESQRRQALGQASGRLKDLYQGWATRLTHARALIEADIDFADEDDVPGSVVDGLWPDLRAIAADISTHLSQASVGEITRSGYRIALIGPPNVGKSSLLNNLAQRDAAIVSDIAGTTRDIVEVRLDIGGHLVLVLDTAGIRESENPIEIEGIRRSLSAAADADLVIELRSMADRRDGIDPDLDHARDKLLVWTKSDLHNSDPDQAGAEGIRISNRTGEGLDRLIAAIGDRLARLDSPAAPLAPTRERHIALLRQCLRELESAIDQVNRAPLEIRAEQLRAAGNTLGRITGTVDVEDLLGVIFSEFCIGK